MIINSDINIIGGLPDFGLILHFLNEEESANRDIDHQSFTRIKTTVAVKRYKAVINKTILHFEDQNVKNLVKNLLKSENISPASLYMLFLNFSYNNHLLHYLNRRVYFPALYSGRMSIKADEVAACLAELKQTEPVLQKWSMKTILLIASKYLTLLKKFGLMEGTAAKTIKTLNMTDLMLIHFVYWLSAIEPKANKLESEWLSYAFSDRQQLVERLLQKKFKNYISLAFSGDNLSIQPIIPYQNLYGAFD